MIIKLLAILEVEVEDGPDDEMFLQARERLDAFREAALPARTHGITIYRAHPDDLILEPVLFLGDDSQYVPAPPFKEVHDQ